MSPASGAQRGPAGRYEVVRELARGGMGRVLLALDRQLDRRVAVKTLLLDQGPGSDQAVARMVEEAQVTGQLAHPNIVPLHELGGDGADLFMVMKLVEGRTLKDVIKDLARGERVVADALPLRRALRLFLDVCEAIAYAHDRGVIHRDLKPANIMVGDDDQVLVMDWGVAKPLGADATVTSIGRPGPQATAVRSLLRSASVADLGASADLTAAGAVVGTPTYMAPEQADGGVALDCRADVYALGATLYELLTHKTPYQGSGHEVLMKLLRGPPPPPRQVAPARQIPPALEAIVLRAMAREPEARYPDARALAADVEAWLDGRAPSAYREPAAEALARLARQHRAALLAAAAGVAVVLAGLGVSAALVGRERARVEAEARQAEEAAEAATTAARAAEAATAAQARAANALGVAGEAVTALEDFLRRSDAALELEPRDAGRVGLAALHAQARADLAACRARLEALAAGAELAPFLEEVAQAGRQVDLAFAESILGRDPAALLPRLDRLDLGPWRAVVEARAHLRLGAPAEAGRVLAAAPATDDAACAACRALVAGLARGVGAAEARRLADAALALTPTAGWLWLRRAEARARQGDFEGAEEDYAQSIRLRRLDGWTHASRAVHTFLPTYQDANTRANVSDVLAVLAPGLPDVGMFESWSLLWSRPKHWQGDFQAHVEALAARDPAAASRWRLRGALLVQEHEEAERAARRLLELAPGDAEGRAGLGEASRRLGRLDEAERLAREVLAQAPEDGLANRTLGRVLAARGERDAASEHLERGARPSLDASDWVELAEHLAGSERAADWGKAEAAARRALVLRPLMGWHHNPKASPFPFDPRPDRVLGRVRRQQGQHARAALHFVRASQHRHIPHAAAVFGGWGQDLLDAGEAHRALGLPNEAAAYFTQAAEDPEAKAEAEARLRSLGAR